MTLIDQVNALAFAMHVIGNTAGGYSPDERAKHTATLQQMLTDAENAALKELDAGNNL